MVNDFKHRSTGVDHASHVLTIGGGSVFRFYSPSLAVPCPSSLNRSSVMPPVGANNYAANKSSQLDSSIVRNPSRTPFFGSQTESVARGWPVALLPPLFQWLMNRPVLQRSQQPLYPRQPTSKVFQVCSDGGKHDELSELAARRLKVQLTKLGNHARTSRDFT